MTRIHPLSANVEESADLLGGKAYGLILMRRLGLPVPPGFVIETRVCRAYLREGRSPSGLDAQLAQAVSDLEAATGRRLGGAERPLAVSVRSGGSVSMPGMMSTVLDLGLTASAAAALADEFGDPRFAVDSRQRFFRTYASAVGGTPPDDPVHQLRCAVEAVFSSWNTPRARTYRELHGIPHDLGTAVTVQAMVYGNRYDHSGTGVAFSRNPDTGERGLFGEVLFGAQGEDVVSGRTAGESLAVLASRSPLIRARLLDALARIEAQVRDACSVEFTFEAGELWLLQMRSGGLVGRAAVRVAVDLVDEGVISREEAVRRVSPEHRRSARTPRIDATYALARGLGASPGVAVGRVATSADRAVRMAAEGPVVLVRPETSPLDMQGLAAAVGIVTARGGPASHAAVVARSMGRPAVVGVAGLVVDAASSTVRVGGSVLSEGALVTVDGGSGAVVSGRAPVVETTADPHLDRLLAWAAESA